MTFSTDPAYRRPAPEGGLAAVVRDGRALRRRRHLAAGTAGATVVAFGVVALSALTPGPITTLREDPAASGPPRPPAVTPTPDVQALPQGPVVSPLPPVSTSTPTASPRPATPASTASPRPTTEPAPARQAWHKPVTRERLPDGTGAVCEANADGWCVSAHVDGVASASRPATVGLDVCRAASAVTEGVLRFADDQELEVVIGRELWRWSVGVTVPARPHTLTVGAGVCLRWSTTWNATTSGGTPVEPGTHAVAASITTSSADLTGTDEITSTR